MGIDQRHVQRRVTEQFLESEDVSTLLNQEACKRVAQCVPGSCEVRTVGCGQELLECNHSHLSQRTDQQRRRAECLPFRKFLCKRQRNRQRPWLPILWESLIGARHRQSVIHQIHILPAQSEDFSAPQPEANREGDSDEQTVVQLGRPFALRSLFRHLEESLRFLCGQSIGAVLPARQRDFRHR